MLNKSAVSLLLSFIAVLSMSCNGSKHAGKSRTSLPGTWQSQPVVIDGDSKDWSSPYPNYDAKAMVAYATSNDKENLYITMETGDPLTQLKILKQGMIVSIDTTGRKEPQFNINYPLQNDSDPMATAGVSTEKSKNISSDFGGSKMDQKLDKNAEDANQFSLDGFPDCNGGFIVTQTTPCGIKVRMKMDEYKELVWEAVVPFKAIYKRNEITAIDAGKPISICFAVNAFKKPDTKGSVENRNGGMNQTTGGGGMSGAMNGGAGGLRTSDNPRDHLYESTKTWKHFGLAFQ